MHRSLLGLGLQSHKSMRVPMLTRGHSQKHLQEACEYQSWPTEKGKTVRSDKILWHHRDSRIMLFTYQEKESNRIHYGEKGKLHRQFYALRNVLRDTCRYYFIMGCLFKHGGWPSAPFHGNSIPWWQRPLPATYAHNYFHWLVYINVFIH